MATSMPMQEGCTCRGDWREISTSMSRLQHFYTSINDLWNCIAGSWSAMICTVCGTHPVCSVLLAYLLLTIVWKLNLASWLFGLILSGCIFHIDDNHKSPLNRSISIMTNKKKNQTTKPPKPSKCKMLCHCSLLCCFIICSCASERLLSSNNTSNRRK